jgi:hypothetical protein
MIFPFAVANLLSRQAIEIFDLLEVARRRPKWALLNQRECNNFGPQPGVRPGE